MTTARALVALFALAWTIGGFLGLQTGGPWQALLIPLFGLAAFLWAGHPAIKEAAR